MPERKRGYLSGIGDEQSVGSDKQRTGPQLRDCREGWLWGAARIIETPG